MGLCETRREVERETEEGVRDSIDEGERGDGRKKSMGEKGNDRGKGCTYDLI